MTYHKVNGPAYLLMLATAVPLYFFFDAHDQPVRGFLAGLTACGIVSVTSILRDIATRTAFVFVMLGIAAAHVVVIALVPWGHKLEFGIIATPVVVLDMYLCARLLVAAVQRSKL